MYIKEQMNDIIDGIMSNNEAVELYQNLFQAMYKVCKKMNWGDPFSYARSREILIANTLGHIIGETYSGCDGYDSEYKYEYKSTISKNIHATYSGIMWQSNWDEQLKYLHNEKIGPYKHIIVRFNNIGEIEEIWEMDADKIISLIAPKLERQFNSLKNRKDPRLSATLSGTEIKKYGIKIK